MSRKKKHSKQLLKSELVNPVATPIRVMYAHGFPKDKNYREQLEPLIGMEIIIAGTYDKFEVKGTEECEETYMLLKNVRVVKKPRLSGKIVDDEINHMWIMCPDDYVIRNKFRKGDILHCKGTVYEYVKNIGNQPSRNIGLNLISTKKQKEKKNPKKDKIISTVVFHETKKKSDLDEYECELTMQIENLIVTQNILSFYDLVTALHDYPILYEIVLRNSEYFKVFIESYSSKNQNVVVVSPSPPTNHDIVKIGSLSYDLSIAQDRMKLKIRLQKVVEDYANANALALKNPKNKFYIIGDGKTILGIQDNQNKTYTSAKKVDFIWGSYQFIDICKFEPNGGFSYRHFNLYK